MPKSNFLQLHFVISAENLMEYCSVFRIVNATFICSVSPSTSPPPIALYAVVGVLSFCLIILLIIVFILWMHR